MKRYLLLPLLLLSSSLCRAQEYIPFTAAEGVGTAQATLGVQSAPALVGTPQVDTAGYSLFWFYTFPDADSGAIVLRRADSTFIGRREVIGDTAWLPVYVRGAPLPRWINSTTAMDLIRVVEDFRQWAARYFDSALTILLAGRLRRPLGEFAANDAVWVFIGQDTVGAGTALLCWCPAEPGSPQAAQCRRLDSGFTAFEGVPAAQALLRTREWPSLVISGEEGVHLSGRARTWVYVFPMPDSLAIVVVQQSLLGFEARLWDGQVDTVEFQREYPLYFRAGPLYLLDSEWIMLVFQLIGEFKYWVQEHGYNPRRAVLAGGTPILPATRGYMWFITAISDDNTSKIRCDCIFEPDVIDILPVCTIISVRDEATADIIVAPNPASDFVLVQAPGVARIRLKGSYTLLGERIELPTVPLSADMLLLDVRSLPSGVYTLSIELGNRLLRSQLRILR